MVEYIKRINSSRAAAILGKKKNCEMYINQGPFKQIKVGDKINFRSDGVWVLVQITEIEYFANFEEALVKYGSKMLPDVEKTYWSDVYYCENSKDNVDKYGVVLFKFILNEL